jgi:hypothetical protein
MQVRSSFALVALISLLLLCACQKDRGDGAKDPLDEGYQLIDRGDYSTAIHKLRTLSLKDSRPAVRVALASAYAARGGIRVGDYWGFVIGFEAPLVPPGSRYKDRVDAIPVVRGTALTDLKLGVETLATVQTPGGRLYRGILNLILFKSYITASGNFWVEFNKVIEELVSGNTTVLCQFDFDELLKWLEPISYHLIEAMNDLVIAFPEDHKELEGARDLIQAIYIATLDAVSELRQKRSCP